MPRNPHKIHCQVPGCRAWAMRGHTRCRAHRDAELGPRGAGAPPGNLNALKHGHHSHPLPRPDLEALARRVVEQPDDLPFQIGRAAQSVQARARDPLLTLIALHRLLSQLIPLVATHLLAAELPAFLQDLPPHLRPRLATFFHRSIPGDSAHRKLLVLRKLRKTTDGTGQLMELLPERPQPQPSSAAPEIGQKQLPERYN